jgi:hypothetical protein
MSTVEFGLLQKNPQHSFVWLEPFLRPSLCKQRAAAHRSGQEWPFFQRPPGGLVLDGCEHGGIIIAPGRCSRDRSIRRAALLSELVLFTQSRFRSQVNSVFETG